MKSGTANTQSKPEEIVIDPSQFKATWVDFGVGLFSISENTSSVASFCAALPVTPANYIVGVIGGVICAFGSYYNVNKGLDEQREREKNTYKQEIKVEKNTQDTRLLLSEALKLKEELYREDSTEVAVTNQQEEKASTPSVVILPNTVEVNDPEKDQESKNINASIAENPTDKKNKRASLTKTPKEKYLLNTQNPSEPAQKSPRASIVRVKTIKTGKVEFKNAVELKKKREAAQLVALARKINFAPPKKQKTISKPKDHIAIPVSEENPDIKIDIEKMSTDVPNNEQKDVIVHLTEENITSEAEKFDQLLEKAKQITEEKKSESNIASGPDAVTPFTSIPENKTDNQETSSTNNANTSAPRVSWFKSYKPQIIETAMAFGKSFLKGSVVGNGMASFMEMNPYALDGLLFTAGIGLVVGGLGAAGSYWKSSKAKISIDKSVRLSTKLDVQESLNSSIRSAYASFYPLLKKSNAGNESQRQESNQENNSVTDEGIPTSPTTPADSKALNEDLLQPQPKLPVTQSLPLPVIVESENSTSKLKIDTSSSAGSTLQIMTLLPNQPETPKPQVEVEQGENKPASKAPRNSGNRLKPLEIASNNKGKNDKSPTTTSRRLVN